MSIWLYVLASATAGLNVGALAGPWLSRMLPADLLGGYVAILIAIVAFRMLFGRRTRHVLWLAPGRC